MKKILLDTSVVIDYLRRSDKENAFLTKLADYNLSIAMISHTELYAGKIIWKKKESRAILEKLLSHLNIVPYTQVLSALAGEIKSKHQDLSLIDSLIAATAIHYDYELATLNLKDFRRIEDLKIYPIK